MPKTYPAVLLVARYGRQLAIVIGGVVAIGAMAALLFGHTVTAVLAAVIAVAVWGLLRLLAEIVEVVAETLLPR